MNVRLLIIALIAATSLTACRSSKPEVIETAGMPNTLMGAPREHQMVDSTMRFTARSYSTIYKADSDYACKVPVAVTQSGNQLIYIPSPASVTTAPIQLCDGYWLATMPINKQTIFTDYDYDEYSQLTETPTADQVLSHIIDGARPTAIVRLPQEMTDTTEINQLIRDGLPGCTIIK